jgi:hypothetical protein
MLGVLDTRRYGCFEFLALKIPFAKNAKLLVN